MTPQQYRRVAQLAGSWARGLYPRPIAIDVVRKAHSGVGIYFCCFADGLLDYVGSANRPLDRHGVARRVFEHRCRQRARWRWVWILPLSKKTPREVVFTIEGQAIGLLRPRGNRGKPLLEAVTSPLPTEIRRGNQE